MRRANSLDFRAALPRVDNEVINQLRDEGMSIRAIASATGTSVGHVHAKVVDAQDDPIEVVDGEPVEDMTTGADGKKYPAKAKKPAKKAPAKKRGKSSTTTLLTVSSPDSVALYGPEPASETAKAFGDMQLGAIGDDGTVTHWLNGEPYDLSAEQARDLAGCLLAAADAAAVK